MEKFSCAKWNFMASAVLAMVVMFSLFCVSCGGDDEGEKSVEMYLEDDSYLSCPDSKHPHWINLGLPSGTLWRCCNDGASWPNNYGRHYIFGEIYSAPTKEQIQELLKHCSSVWTTLNGVNGRIFTGPNGGTIFLPTAGYHYGDTNDVVGLCGFYWSSTPYDEENAYGMGFDSLYTECYNGYFRYGEQSVRSVRQN